MKVHELLKYRATFFYLFVVWTLAGLSVGGAIALTNASQSFGFWVILASYVFRLYTWGALSPLIYVVAQRFEIKSGSHRLRNVSINLLFGLTLTLVHTQVFEFLNQFLLRPYIIQGQAYNRAPESNLPQLLVFSLICFYLPTAFAVQTIISFRNFLSEESKNVKLMTELSDARLSALKMQLHPHFLFNSLHAISSLILVDPHRANKMVALLGDFLRQTLDHSNDSVVSLEEEIGFLRCYLAIEETRFEDRLTVHFDIDRETLGLRVPHLIMQPIVENAVKHGIAPFADPGTITISAKRTDQHLVLEVQDSGKKLNNIAESNVSNGNGVGISNVRSRLSNLYGDEASLSVADQGSEGYRVILKLPQPNVTDSDE